MSWEEVFKARDNRELAERYDIWAKAYESDVADYPGPQHTVEVLIRYDGPEARILDAGCGTGLTGQILHAQGYHRVEGLDLSAGMLAEARQKNCYAALHQQALGRQTGLLYRCLDAVVCVGIFARAYAPSHAEDRENEATVLRLETRISELGTTPGWPMGPSIGHSHLCGAAAARERGPCLRPSRRLERSRLPRDAAPPATQGIRKEGGYGNKASEVRHGRSQNLSQKTFRNCSRNQ